MLRVVLQLGGLVCNCSVSECVSASGLEGTLDPLTKRPIFMQTGLMCVTGWHSLNSECNSSCGDLGRGCRRVPREVESKITQWVRFQYTEQLSDMQVCLPKRKEKAKSTTDSAEDM